MSFQPNRQLLNPKFDGYKLSPVSEADVVASFQLPGSGISQSKVSSRSHLFFPEIQNRIRHNHLAIAQDDKAFCYIDEDGQVVLITLDEVCTFQQVVFGFLRLLAQPPLCYLVFGIQSDMLRSLIGYPNPKLPPDLRNSTRHPNRSSRCTSRGVSVCSLLGPRCLDRV